MMWGMGDGSSDVAHGRHAGQAAEQDAGIGGAAAAGAVGAGASTGGMGGREATDAEMYGPDSNTPSSESHPAPAPSGDDAVRGRGYNEELGWGQDAWENEEVMEDPWTQDQGDDDGFFGGGGGGGDFGDFGDWS